MSRRLLFLFIVAVCLLTGVGLVSANSTTFSITPDGPVVIGTPLTLHCTADQGTTRYEIVGTLQSSEHFNEFAGPDNIGYLKTEEWGAGTLTITCAVRRGNDWANAERITKTVQVLSGQGGSNTTNGNSAGGFYSGSNPPPLLPSASRMDNGQVDLITYCEGSQLGDPIGTTDVGGLNCGGTQIPWEVVCDYVWGGTAWHNINGHNPNGVRCGGSAAVPSQNITHPQGNPCEITALVTKGGAAQILPGIANNLRNSASTTGKFVVSIPGGSTISIIDGPTCANGHRWWKVNFNGTIGWTADGDSNEYWMQGVGATSVVGNNANADTVVSKTFNIHGQSITLNMDTSTYVIKNGAELVALQLRTVSDKINEQTSQSGKAIALGSYEFPSVPFYDGGESEVQRREIVEAFCGSDTRCSDNIKYQFGYRSADPSSIGNIVFGYFCAELGIGTTAENTASNFDQFINPKSLGHVYDNPDDFAQRRLGRTLYGLNPNPYTVTTDQIENTAVQVDLF